jgi:hypothetical protein
MSFFSGKLLENEPLSVVLIVAMREVVPVSYKPLRFNVGVTDFLNAS